MKLGKTFETSRRKQQRARALIDLGKLAYAA